MKQMAIVQWTASVGLAVVHRDSTSLTLQAPSGQKWTYTILALFPFTSETKRMVRTPCSPSAHTSLEGT